MTEELLNKHDCTNSFIDQLNLTHVLKQTNMNQSKLYAIMAKQIHEKYLRQENQKKRKLNFYEQQFRSYIQQMPKYVCTVCHRCMFQSDIKFCNREKYKLKFDENAWSSILSCFSGTYVNKFAFEPCQRTEWICNSCHTSLWKGKIPVRSVIANNLVGGHLPEEIQVLNDLE
ncbi:unnamed protein product [Rotaria sp. Silwood1]|nr:unnamed protein product [Rotaria sp. Silwood1]